MTASDVPDLMEKTRNLMLETLHDLSAAAGTSSPTPLLLGERGTSYEAVSRTAPLQGAVAGANPSDSELVEASLDDTPESPLLARHHKAGTERESKRNSGKKSIA